VLPRLRFSILVVVVLATLAVAAPVTAAVAGVDGTSQQRPFIWPTTGRITQPFGCTGFVMEPRRGSCAHFHYGADIANARGTPVYAAADGVISLVGWDPWLRHNPDWMVIVDHPGGFKTMYAHLRAAPLAGIEKGAHVTQHQLIGYMDSTGHSTGPHLLWGLFLDHRPLDPLLYVQGTLRRD
jgi:murein DD-endopeptidase MepM/ murein hydrolase activator NlpD